MVMALFSNGNSRDSHTKNNRSDAVSRGFYVRLRSAFS